MQGDVHWAWKMGAPEIQAVLAMAQPKDRVQRRSGSAASGAVLEGEPCRNRRTPRLRGFVGKFGISCVSSKCFGDSKCFFVSAALVFLVFCCCYLVPS